MPIRSKNTRVDVAYCRLKSEIIESKLPPGFQGPEPDIARRLGMSRTPVREALIRLESEGLIQLVPRRGVRVLGISNRDLVDIYEILATLEAQGASSLAKRKLAAEDLEKLEEQICDMEKAYDDANLERWLKAEEQFHRLLLALSDNWRLEKIVRSLHDQVHRARIVLLRLRGVPVVSAQDYRDLLNAIVSGDSVSAYEIAQQCRRRAQEVFQGMFQASKLSQV